MAGLNNAGLMLIIVCQISLFCRCYLQTLEAYCWNPSEAFNWGYKEKPPLPLCQDQQYNWGINAIKT